MIQKNKYTVSNTCLIFGKKQDDILASHKKDEVLFAAVENKEIKCL